MMFIESYLQKRSSRANFLYEVGNLRKICELPKNTEISRMVKSALTMKNPLETIYEARFFCN